jgi:hypothetical protein
MEYKPERLPDVYVNPWELRGTFEVGDMFCSGDAMLIDDFIATLREAKAAAESIGYTNVQIMIEANEDYDHATLDWELRGSRMETDTEVSVRKRGDEIEAEREAAKAAKEVELYKELRRKYGDAE